MMRATFCHAPSSLHLLLILVILLLSPSASSTSSSSRHHHHHSHGHHPAAESSKSSSNELTEETTATTPQPAENSGAPIMADDVTSVGGGDGIRTTKDLFRQYLGRGMLTCTSEYVEIIQKLNALIASAHGEFMKCQRQAEKADRSGQSAEKARKLAAQLEMINEILDD